MGPYHCTLLSRVASTSPTLTHTYTHTHAHTHTQSSALVPIYHSPPQAAIALLQRHVCDTEWKGEEERGHSYD